MVMVFYLIFIGLFFFFYFNNKRNKNNSNKNNNIQSNNIGNNYYANNTQNMNYINQGNVINNQVNIINNQKNMVDNQKKQTNTMLNFGVILIILSSIIFATTTWSIVADYIKVLILFFESMLFLGMGIFLKTKFNIKKSGDALTFISAILFGITFLSLGFFKLFGTEFSLFGSFKYLFLFLTFYIESIVLIFRNILNKKNDYCLILVFALLGFFFLLMQIIGNAIYSCTVFSIVLLILNILKKEVFKEEQGFNIISIITTVILSFGFLISCTKMTPNDNILRIAILLYYVILFANVFIMLKNNKEVHFLSIMYQGFLLFFFCIFSDSLIFSSLTLFFTSVLLYFIYYFFKEYSVKVSSIIYFYIQGILSVVFMFLAGNVTILATIISFSLFLMMLFANLKEKSLIKISNSIFELIFSMFFVFLLMETLNVLSKIDVHGVILICNFITLFYYILNKVLKNNSSRVYLILLMIGIFIGCSISDLSIVFIVIYLILNMCLFLYNNLSKEAFNKKISFYISLLFVVNCICSCSSYEVIQLILTLLSIIVFYFMNHENKNKDLFISLLYIPLVMFFDLKYINMSGSIKTDLLCYLTVPFILNITRRLLKIKDENKSDISVVELIIFSILLLSISNNIILIMFTITLVFLAYIFSYNSYDSSRYYFNYLIFAIPLLCYKIENIDNIIFYLSLFILYILHIATQCIYILINNVRKKGLEVAHSILSFILTMFILEEYGFNIFISSIISVAMIMLLYFIYSDKNVKYLSLVYITIPIMELIDNFTSGTITDILERFILLLPVFILTRKVFNMANDNKKIFELIALSLIFLSIIFTIDIFVAIALGIISITLIIIGYLVKYKELTLFGYISLSLMLIIQTSSLWTKLPWWAFLLLFGIILVGFAIYNENKKN